MDSVVYQGRFCLRNAIPPKKQMPPKLFSQGIFRFITNFKYWKFILHILSNQDGIILYLCLYLGPLLILESLVRGWKRDIVIPSFSVSTTML